jgi:hypothetical protein
MLTWTTWARPEPTDSSITRKLSRIWRVCDSISVPASWPVAGLTPAVAPLVMKLPTFATWSLAAMIEPGQGTQATTLLR